MQNIGELIVGFCWEIASNENTDRSRYIVLMPRRA